MPLDPEDKVRIGVIAQEIEKIAPYCTFKYKGKLNPNDEILDDIYGYVHDPLIYVLVNAIKELDSENKLIQTKIGQLQERIEILEKNK